MGLLADKFQIALACFHSWEMDAIDSERCVNSSDTLYDHRAGALDLFQDFSHFQEIYSVRFSNFAFSPSYLVELSTVKSGEPSNMKTASCLQKVQIISGICRS